MTPLTFILHKVSTYLNCLYMLNLNNFNDVHATLTTKYILHTTKKKKTQHDLKHNKTKKQCSLYQNDVLREGCLILNM